MYICIATYPRFTLAHPYVLNSSLSFNSGHSLLVYLISSKFVQPFVEKKQTYIHVFFSHLYYSDDCYCIPATISTPTMGRRAYCPQINARGLHWNWTLAGTYAVQPCPGGATGLARWK